ncbi:hypothetical protein TPA0598_03_01770 [Streptomyces lydicamycinicus]|uniref:Uncharacterized protein n=1 Tax=Streptomyces lydicamycinicus TaxID=1546107 RepID=A0A0P4R4B4_9ACTN|nr:hypothetical protein [Streptomyces lydicamycinicus]GAO07716.1 hypothetical protein TPA0598_03_01770 [Streptomyces lydicamycinicus]
MTPWSDSPDVARSPERCPCPSPCLHGSAVRTTGRGGTPLSPHHDRAFGELTEPFRHGAARRPRPALRGPARPRPHHRFAWLAPAAAAGILAAGVVLAHGLLLATGLVLAGLLGQLSAYGRDRHR